MLKTLNAQSFKSRFIALMLLPLSAIFFASFAHATVVEIRTNMGNIQVNLFDQTSPETVANFLDYVNSGAYANNVVHRSVPDFVVQMGGFQYNGSFPPDAVPTGTSVVNEPELSNLRGTIAMAKLSGAPNSATSQFFINMANNAANLDVTNGGFTVFGQVINNGMDVADAINELDRFGFTSTFAEVPLQDYTQADIDNNVEPDTTNLVIVTDIVVIDSTVNSAASLNPTPNTLINNSTPSNPSSSGGGGSVGFVTIACLLVLSIRRKLI